MNWIKKELKAEAGNAPLAVKIAAGFAGGVLMMGICKSLDLPTDLVGPLASGVAAFVAFVAWRKR